MLPNPTVIDCGESLGTDPWMLHMLPARGRPYNSGSAYISVNCIHLLYIFAITSVSTFSDPTALESPSNHF